MYPEVILALGEAAPSFWTTWQNGVFLLVFLVGVFFAVAAVASWDRAGIGMRQVETLGGDVAVEDAVRLIELYGEDEGEENLLYNDLSDEELDRAVEELAARKLERKAGGSADAGLEFVGLGKIPPAVLVPTFCFTTATSGWVMNGMVVASGRMPGVLSPVIVVVAVVLGAMAMRGVTGAVLRRQPAFGAARGTAGKYVGREAVAAVSISASFGRALVAEGDGAAPLLCVRVPEGKPPIGKGEAVLLVRYEARADGYVGLPAAWVKRMRERESPTR